LGPIRPLRGSSAATLGKGVSMSAMTDSAPNKPRLLYAPRWSLMCGVQIVQLLLDDIAPPEQHQRAVVRVRTTEARGASSSEPRSRSNSLVLARYVAWRASKERHHDRRLGCTEHQLAESPHKRIKAIRRRIARERLPGAELIVKLRVDHRDREARRDNKKSRPHPIVLARNVSRRASEKRHHDRRLGRV
jgi:hypothetical protein